MGNWNINISGVGAHGNRLPQDIEQLYKKFLREIQDNGHNIVNKSCTYGGAYYDEHGIPPVLKVLHSCKHDSDGFQG